MLTSSCMDQSKSTMGESKEESLVIDTLDSDKDARVKLSKLGFLKMISQKTQDSALFGIVFFFNIVFAIVAFILELQDDIRFIIFETLQMLLFTFEIIIELMVMHELYFRHLWNAFNFLVWLTCMIFLIIDYVQLSKETISVKYTEQDAASRALLVIRFIFQGLRLLIFVYKAYISLSKFRGTEQGADDIIFDEELSKSKHRRASIQEQRINEVTGRNSNYIREQRESRKINLNSSLQLEPGVSNRFPGNEELRNEDSDDSKKSHLELSAIPN